MARIGESAQHTAVVQTASAGATVPPVGTSFIARFIAGSDGSGLTLVTRGLRIPLGSFTASEQFVGNPVRVTVVTHQPQITLSITAVEQQAESVRPGVDTASSWAHTPGFLRVVFMAMARAGVAFDQQLAARAWRWIQRTQSQVSNRSARIATDLVGRALDGLDRNPAEELFKQPADFATIEGVLPADSAGSDEVRTDLAAAIEAVLRQLSVPTTSPDHPLQLYNHTLGRSALHWVELPFRLATTIELQGTLRVGLELQSGRVVVAAVEANSTARRWWFVLHYRATAAHSLRWGADPEPSQRIIAGVKTLAAAHGIVHTTLDAFERFDGFDADELMNEGVDGYG